MKPIILFIVLMGCAVLPPSLSAQVVDSTVCDILANPQSYDGKIVRIRGIVVAGFEEFAVKGAGCNQMVNAIWVTYPAGTKGKAGPAAFLRLQLGKNHPAGVTNVSRAPVTLEKNKEFKDFDNLLSTPAKTNGMCLGCVKFTVTATLVGRLDGTKETGLIRDVAGRVTGLGGFGNLNRYNARLVLQSVSEISSQEIDYVKGVIRFRTTRLRRAVPLRQEPLGPTKSNVVPMHSVLLEKTMESALDSAEQMKFLRTTAQNPARIPRMDCYLTLSSTVSG